MRSAAQSTPRCAQPDVEEFVATMFGKNAGDGGLIGLGRGGAERERHFAEPQLEQPVSAPRLAIVVALGRRPGEDLDLAVVEAEAPVDRGDLRLDRPLVGQEQSRRAALDDRGRNGGAVDVARALRGEDDGSVLLSERLQPLAELAGETFVIQRQPSLVDDDAGSARPSSRSSMLWNR